MVSTNVRKITLALIGNGRWGKNYIKTISSLNNCILPESYIVTRDYKKLAKYSDIDGVIIATPPKTHYEIAKYFLERKMNILVEKPVTLKYFEAKQLEKISKINKVVGMVGNIYEYHTEFNKLLETVNPLRISYIYTEGLGNGPVRADVSALWDWGPHDIGMCMSLMRSIPLRVGCWEHVANGMYLVKLVFPGDVTSISRIGWLSLKRKRSVLVVEGKKSTCFYDSKSSYSRTPLACEIEEFVNCIVRKRDSRTNLIVGASTVKILELLEKSLISDGKLVTVS